jgi:lysophospholipase L1-like esterase
MKRSFSSLWVLSVLAAGCWVGWAGDAPVKGETFELDSAPKTKRLMLKPGDRLAICGDSITEQKMYSRILETYLTVCTPELKLSIRQFGWSGERADGFFERMRNDVLRFKPTIATTCYGMNDHRYRTYEPWIGELYRIHLDAVVRWFEADKVRVVVGSAGPVGKVPHWVKDAGPTVDALNGNLAELRNLAIRVARKRGEGFADIFQPMLKADQEARAKYGTNYAVPGKDGVHPGWAGQLIMAYAFLEGLRLGGDLGSVTIDMGGGQARATARGGHTVTDLVGDLVTLKSTRYPFCAPPAELSDDNSIRSGMQWVPFQERFNRLKLVVKGLSGAAKHRVIWGTESRVFETAALKRGINLAAEFPVNPFSEPFKAVDEAIAAKQVYETAQIKGEFHGEAGRADMEGTVRRTEEERAAKVAAIKTAFQPVVHTIRVVAE